MPSTHTRKRQTDRLIGRERERKRERKRGDRERGTERGGERVIVTERQTNIN